MELIDHPVRVPDIDEYPAMRDVTHIIRDAYMSLDFAELIGLFAPNVVYISHIAQKKVEGIEAVAAHFRKKAFDIKQENEMTFAFPAQLILSLFQWEFVPENEQAFYHHHHGEPVVILGYDRNITRTKAIVRFTLDEDGKIASLVLYNRRCFRDWIAPEIEVNLYFEYNKIAIEWIAKELVDKRFELHEIHFDRHPHLVLFRNERLFFVIVEAARYPYEALFTQEQIDRFYDHCAYHEAVGLMARVCFRMVNDRPWDIRLSDELKNDYVIEGLASDEALIDKKTN
jgi:hypothetical protein